MSRNTGGVQSRKNSLDLLRIVSTIAVVLIHVNWHFFSWAYDYTNNTLEWTIMSMINILTRFSVPCFVMISGAFILNNYENEKPEKFYRKTTYKIFLPAIIAFIFMTILVVIRDVVKGVNILQDILSMFKGTSFNMWYIWMLAGLYILTPFIIIVKKRITFRQYTICSLFMLIWAVVSQASSHQVLPYSIGVVFAYISYFTVGDVIKNIVDKGNLICRTKIVSICLLLVSFASALVTYFWRKGGHNYYISDAHTNFFSPTIVIYSISVFILFNLLNTNRDYSKLSNKTYFIYLFHTIVLIAVSRLIERIGIDNVIVKIIFISLLTLIGAYICGEVFRRLWFEFEKHGLKEKWYSMTIWKTFEESLVLGNTKDNRQ